MLSGEVGTVTASYALTQCLTYPDFWDWINPTSPSICPVLCLNTKAIRIWGITVSALRGTSALNCDHFNQPRQLVSALPRSHVIFGGVDRVSTLRPILHSWTRLTGFSEFLYNSCTYTKPSLTTRRLSRPWRERAVFFSLIQDGLGGVRFFLCPVH